MIEERLRRDIEKIGRDYFGDYLESFSRDFNVSVKGDRVDVTIRNSYYDISPCWGDDPFDDDFKDFLLLLLEFYYEVKEKFPRVDLTVRDDRGNQLNGKTVGEFEASYEEMEKAQSLLRDGDVRGLTELLSEYFSREDILRLLEEKGLSIPREGDYSPSF